MIVVINPSGSSGYSFKGLNAYCSHDQERAKSAERVDWIDTRNLASDDPQHAWKIMAATAQSQSALKQAAGIKNTGRKSNAHVQHIVLSFHENEPQTPEAMREAADALLSKIGADPAKSRGKAKPALRQFADEHQAVYYAHSDTKNAHLHIMLNRVHPEHGVMLPSKNDQLKASKWAQAYSKQHGTEHATPNRTLNNEARNSGEYVKADRRKSRNIYEHDKELHEASNDNDRLKALKEAQTKRDAALALMGRNMAKLHKRAWVKLAEAHQSRKDALSRQLRRDENKARAEAREALRPARLKLDEHQNAERQTFEALESSFFGRLVSAARLSGSMVRAQESGIIKRTFGVIRNGGARKQYFEEAQERARKALRREEADRAATAIAQLRGAQALKLAATRATFLEERAQLAETQKAEHATLKQGWKTRTAQREEALTEFREAEAKRAAILKAQREAAGPKLSPAQRRILERYRNEFDSARQPTTREQNIERDRGDDDRER